MSMKVGHHLQKATARRNLTQAKVARRLNYARTTANGYFNDDPAPYHFVRGAAELFNDSEFNMNVASEMFGTIPAMDGEVYHDNPIILETLHEHHANQRDTYRQEALLIMTKRKQNITVVERQTLETYAEAQLDELFIKTKLVIEILGICDKSIMTAITARKVIWKKKGYLRR